MKNNRQKRQQITKAWLLSNHELISVLLAISFVLVGNKIKAEVTTPPSAEERERHYRQLFIDSKEAIQKNPKDAVAYYGLALALQSECKYEQAIANYTKAIMCDLGFIDAYADRAQVYAIIHRPQKALADYVILTNMRPSDPTFHSNTGLCYFELGEYQKAVDEYTASIELDKDSSAYMMRADAYDKLGKRDLAEQDRKTARALPAHGTITPVE